MLQSDNLSCSEDRGPVFQEEKEGEKDSERDGEREKGKEIFWNEEKVRVVRPIPK